MIAASKSVPKTIAGWLSHFGWQQGDRLQSSDFFSLPQSEAVLQRIAASSQSEWSAWALGSPLVSPPHPKGVFTANRGIPGPWKFVTNTDGAMICRADVPRDVLASDDAFHWAGGQTPSPLQSWAETVTAIAAGLEPTGDDNKPDPQFVVDWLKERGFVASLDGNAAKVTVPLSGTFREVAVRWDNNGLVNLSAEVGRLDNWPENSIAAAWQFLQQANRRLRLVRVSQMEASRIFSMEVCFKASGPGVWLQAGLDSLCIGMALVVQPLASLRDSGAADMLLAGILANQEKGDVQ